METEIIRSPAPSEQPGAEKPLPDLKLYSDNERANCLGNTVGSRSTAVGNELHMRDTVVGCPRSERPIQDGNRTQAKTEPEDRQSKDGLADCLGRRSMQASYCRHDENAHKTNGH
jgi:hypothetical protein